MRVTWLLDGRLAASGMIGGGDLDRIGTYGLMAVLSLSMRSPFPDGPLPGLAHLHLPTPDMTAPAPESLRRAVEFIQVQLREQRPVLVHCGAGLGRTGTVLACYLVSMGRSAEEAIRAVREARPGSIETAEQEWAIRAYES